MQLGLFETATTKERVAEEGSPERKQLRQGIFYDNAWDHWCAAVREPPAPRGAQTLPVTFMGFRLDGAALLGALDLLVVPSFSEGTPLVVLEAAAAGVPVVASTVGGIPEQACHEVEALLVTPGDDAALEVACRRLLLDPALAAQLAAAARLKLREADPHAQLDAVEALYRQVLNAEPVGLGTP